MQDNIAADQFHMSNKSDVVPSTVTSDNSIISATKSSITIGTYYI